MALTANTITKYLGNVGGKLEVTNSGITDDGTIATIDRAIDWSKGNTTFVPIDGDIATYVTSATAGDKLVLACGTYTVNTQIDVNKSLVIEGCSKYSGTTINSTNATAFNIFNVTASNVTIRKLSVTHSTNLTGGTNLVGINVTGVAGTVLSGVVVEDVYVQLSGSDVKNRIGIYYTDASGRISRVSMTNTNAGNGQVTGILYQGNSTQEANTVLTVEYPLITSNGTGATGTTFNDAILHYNNNAPNFNTLNINGGSLSASASASSNNIAYHVIDVTSGKSIDTMAMVLISGANNDLGITSGTGAVTVYGGTILSGNKVTGSSITYKSWTAWTPTLTWGTADPASITTVARYTLVDNLCRFNLYVTSADGNDASSLTATLPFTPKDINAYIACSSHQLVDTTWTDPLAYIDALDNTAGNRLLTFRNFSAATNAKTVTLEISGCYEI